jgi:hypothetical protein
MRHLLHSGLIAQIVPIVGALLGVALGAWLAAHFSRKQSVATNKKEEYRILMTALTRCYYTFVGIADPPPGTIVDEQPAFADATLQFTLTVGTLIFIDGDVVVRLKVLDRWRRALEDFRTTRDLKAFTNVFSTIVDEIQKEAKKLG